MSNKVKAITKYSKNYKRICSFLFPLWVALSVQKMLWIFTFMVVIILF